MTYFPIKSGVHFLSKNRGFSLIESLVAITVLLTAVVAPLVIVSGSIATANIAKDQITAFYLANEAIEYIHNVRDTNFLGGADWLTGLSDCIVGGTEKCEIDGLAVAQGPGGVIPCIGGVCPNLFLNIYNNPAGTFYNHDILSSGRQTTFNRSVVITSLSADEAKVQITVTWKTGSLLGTGSIDKQFKAVTIMRRWI